MFKRFDLVDEISGKNALKSSLQKAFRAEVIANYPLLDGVLESIFGDKKSQIIQIKCHDRINLYATDPEAGDILFFKTYDECPIPTLRLVYFLMQQQPQQPFFKRAVVDSGAIRAVLGGADVMCPGVTRPADQQPFERGEILLLYADSKQNPLAVVKSLMSWAEICEKQKDAAFQTLHVLGDGLWKVNAAAHK